VLGCLVWQRRRAMVRGWGKKELIGLVMAVGALSYLDVASLYNMSLRLGERSLLRSSDDHMPGAAPALEVWPAAGLESSSSPQAAVCRIHSACYDKERGKWVLPTLFLQPPLSTALPHCGMTEENTLYSDSLTRGHLTEEDFMGPRTWGENRPVSFLQAITPVMYMVDRVAMGGPPVCMDKEGRECGGPASGGGGEATAAARRRVRRTLLPYHQSLRPVFAEPVGNAWRFNMVWMLYKGLGATMKILNAEAGETPPTCFRSLVTTPLTVAKLPRDTFAQDSSIYT
jgi:hypothetical protein